MDFTDLAIGDKVVLPIGHANEQHIRMNYTLGGSGGDVTVDAMLMPMSMIDGYTNYPDGFTIS